MDCYCLVGSFNRINVSSYFKDSGYTIIARHPYNKALYITGPEVEPNDDLCDIEIYRVRYIPPKDAIKRSKSPVIRIMMTTDDITVMNGIDVDGIISILCLFLVRLNERCPLPNGCSITYTFDYRRYALHVQLPTAEHAVRACDPNDPIFDAYPYIIDDQIVYMHSLQQTKNKTLRGPLCRKYKLPRLDDICAKIELHKIHIDT